MKARMIKAVAGMGLVASIVMPAYAGDEYCREFTQNIAVGGKIQEAYGTACMQPDGSWERVSEMQIEGANVQEAAYYPVGQRMEPQVIVQQPPIYVAPPPIYVTPRPVYRHDSLYFGSNGVSFRTGYGTAPYYLHGRYYNPHYWDRHWDHHRKYNRHDWDRGHRRHDNDHHGRGHDRD